MQHGYKFIDSDAHVLEPSDLWEKYLEPKYRSRISHVVGYDRATPDGPLRFNTNVVVDGNLAHIPFSSARAGGTPVPGLEDAYARYAEAGFPPQVYKEVMDNSGIDYMIVYPTAGLYATAVPNMEAEMAMAFRRAYNTWLGDFCAEAGGRVFGAAAIDMRDPEGSAREARRCVKDLDFKAVVLNPTPVDGHHIFDEACDPLWAEIADLDVPVGIHVGGGNASDSFLFYYLPGQNAGTLSTAGFAIGNMIASMAFISGGVLERHPKLRVVHLEAGSGWAAYWPERLASSVNGGSRGRQPMGLSMFPVEYFQRQCFVAADQDDPGIKQAIEAVGDDNIVTATDFGHGEGRRYGQAVEMLLELPGVSDESKKKILWDNALRLYPIKPEA